MEGMHWFENLVWFQHLILTLLLLLIGDVINIFLPLWASWENDHAADGAAPLQLNIPQSHAASVTWPNKYMTSPSPSWITYTHKSNKTESLADFTFIISDAWTVNPQVSSNTMQSQCAQILCFCFLLLSLLLLFFCFFLHQTTNYKNKDCLINRIEMKEKSFWGNPADVGKVSFLSKSDLMCRFLIYQILCLV